jgi:hypothetical protein
MNLHKIGNTVLNLDRLNAIIDHQVSTDPGAPTGRNVLRVVFDNAQIELVDKEAQIFRRWYRHVARNLDPHKDEDGEELIGPELQVTKALESLLGLVDRARPRDSALRHSGHRLRNLIERYLTGELQAVRASDFERTLGERHVESPPVPASPSETPPAHE